MRPRWNLRAVFRPVMATVALGAAAVYAADTARPLVPGSVESIERANITLGERLAGASTVEDRCYALGRIVLVEKPGGDLGKVAEELYEQEVALSAVALVRLFEDNAPPVQRRVLELFDANWARLTRGVDPHITDFIRHGLESADPGVRRAAAELIAHQPVFGITHPAIDAATRHPELTLAVLRSIATGQDGLGTRWVFSRLASTDARVRQEALRTLAVLGANVKPVLREKLDDGSSRVRQDALEALLLVASDEDLSVLHAWLDQHAKDDPALRDRLTRAIAELEAGRYKPPATPPVEPLFPPDSRRPARR